MPEAAQSAFTSMTDVPYLILRVEREARRLRQRRVIKRVAAAVVILAVIGFGVVVHFKGMFGLMQLAKLGIGLIAGGAALSQSHKKDVSALAELNDPATIGPLAGTLRYDDKDVRAVSEQALIRILPLVSREHAAAISPEQLDSLHHELKLDNAEAHSALMRAIIRALPIIGNEESLERVHTLARATSHSDNEALVQQTALQTLPLLQQHVEEARIAASLLRPVETPPDSSAVLLRPAAGSPEANEDSLLRPVNRAI